MSSIKKSYLTETKMQAAIAAAQKAGLHIVGCTLTNDEFRIECRNGTVDGYTKAYQDAPAPKEMKPKAWG